MICENQNCRSSQFELQRELVYVDHKDVDESRQAKECECGGYINEQTFIMFVIACVNCKREYITESQEWKMN